MTAERIAFEDAFDEPVELVPVVLVAGVPRVWTPEGVHPTDTVWNGPADPAWWPGTGPLEQTLPSSATFDPVREVLDTRDPLVVTARVDPEKGDVDAGSVAFDLSDVDGQTTADLSARDAHHRTRLTQDVAIGDTSIYVESFGALVGELATIGRETVTYSGTSNSGGAHLTGVDRGQYGSRERRHLALVENPAVVADGVRYLYGRRCTVWIARWNAATGELEDPTLWFDGVVGNGTELVDKGTRWHITADASSTILTAKIPAPTVTISGVHHFRHTGTAGYASPWTDVLAVQWLGVDYTLGDDDSGGYHPDALSFLGDLGVRIGAALRVTPGNPPAFRANNTSGSTGMLAVFAAWATPQRSFASVPNGETGTITLSRAMPNTVAWLNGWLHVGQPGDWDRIPSTLSYTDSGTDTTAYWALAAETDKEERLVARILQRDITNRHVRLSALVDADQDPWEVSLITKRTTARLVLVVDTAEWWAGIRTALSAVSGEWGADHLDDAVDWDHVAEQARTYRSPIPSRRRYVFDFEDSFLTRLVSEARLNGFVLAHRKGRITIVRLAGFARTEQPAWTITEDDVVGGEYSLKEAANGLIIGMEVEREDGGTIRVLDTTSVAEFGDGAIVKVKATGLEATLSDDRLAQGLAQTVPLVLGPYAEPYQHAGITLGPTFYGVETGDLALLTHEALPNGAGTRGLTEAVVQVVDVERRFAGGEAVLAATLRLPEADLVGWAPEAFIASVSGAVLTLDTATGFGASGFAPSGTDGGAAWFGPSRSGSNAKVVLSQIGTRTPISEERRTVVSVSGNTVTLDAAPSAGMATAIATQYGVLLRFDTYDNSTGAKQHDFAFIADGSAGTIPASSSTPDRWGS